jgi:hypothetical protein
MRIHLLCFSDVHGLFGSLLEYRCVVRHVSPRCRNYLFSINKVRINGLVISHLCGFTTILFSLLLFFSVFFISSILILQMVNTRNRVTANNAGNNGGSNNQEANPPLPPPLTLEHASIDASDHAADPGQLACTTPSATAAEG